MPRFDVGEASSAFTSKKRGSIFDGVKPTTGRVPPQNLEAEQSLLGALLLDRDAIVSVAEFLRPEHFYLIDQHGAIFNAILSLFERRKPVDIITVTEQLKAEGSLEQSGGTEYLASLVEKVPTAAHVEYYGRIIRDHFTKRRLVGIAAKLSDAAFDNTQETKDILDQAEAQIFSISQEHMHQDFIPIKDALSESFERLDDLHKNKGKLRGVPTGYKTLDAKMAGMQDSNLIILAARPGIGKTSLALNIAEHVATVEGLPVGIFSLEMSKEELVDRLLVGQADVDAWKLKTGRLEEDDFERIAQAMGELADAPLYIDDTPGASIMEIRTKARRLQIEVGIKLLIVDYLQLITTNGKAENRVVEVSQISQSLKNLARELKIPVLALSQLNRQVESRGERRPQLADLRESGAIEQDADLVMFLYHEDPDNKEAIKLEIAKHRNGPTGVIDLIFKGDRVKFYEVDHRRKKDNN